MPRNAPQAIAFMLGFWFALWLSPLTLRVASAQPDLEEFPNALESELHEAVNETRARHKRIALVRHAELDAVARAHSTDMANRHYFNHVSPEGVNPVDRIERGGVDGFTLAAENLGQTDEVDPTAAILDGWLASVDHRRNLLAPPFNATGIGIARGADGSLVYTQVYVTYPR